MFFVVWEFHVKPEQVAEFERHYSGNGTWAQLFREDPAYKETVLLRDPKTEGRYLTTDIWQNEDSYRAFQERARERYRELDTQFAALTGSEALVGHFEVVE
ncbi:MAG: antibiotic biosynthesis monooxygenase [Terriglobales bacterium]